MARECVHLGRRRCVLQVHGGRAGDHVGGDGVVHLAQDGAGAAHLFDLGGGFDQDGHKVRLLVAGY